MSSEMLSAALDGECNPAELDQLLTELERSSELRLQWSRMCLARDALAGARLKADQPCICAGVLTAVEGQSPSEKVTALVPRRSRISWRPVIGLATAASVASVAFVLGYRSPAVPPMVTAKAPASLVATPASTQVIAGDISQVRPAAVDARAPAESSLEEWDSRQLNHYLIDYSSYRAGAGMADTLGYARFAAHTAEYNPDH
jgi:negative regulator of sigma E activity